jgi:renalase
MKPVAVIGTGIAGLTAARVLVEADIPVVVFDKSRAVGGRMATRRGDYVEFDHGAQYFKATTPEFREEIATWERAGVAAAWGEGRFVGVPDMTAPARATGADLTLNYNCTISALTQTNGAWFVSALEGAVAQPVGGFGAVLLAIPAPQVANVLAASGLKLLGVDIATYAPCWALMVALEKPIQGHAPSVKPASEIIAWIANNSSKPQRAPRPACYVAHAHAAWSRANLELSREDARDVMLAEFATLTGADLAGSSAVAHRWRYALVERAVGQPCLFDAQASVGACGDWCLGPRVEDAWLSGRALGQRLVQHLAKPSSKAT